MGNQEGCGHELVLGILILMGSWRLIVLDHHVALVSQQWVSGSVLDFCCTHLPFLGPYVQDCVRCFGSSSCTY
jgi:hypothetical protein